MSNKTSYAWSELTPAGGGDFWSVVGPLSTSRQVIKDLGGYPVYVTENQTWVVARDADGNVAGVASVPPAAKKDGSFWIDYAYVAPGHRGNALWTELLSRRLAIATAAGARSVKCCTATLTRPLEAKGFKVTSQRGSWSYMEKAL